MSYSPPFVIFHACVVLVSLAFLLFFWLELRAYLQFSRFMDAQKRVFQSRFLFFEALTLVGCFGISLDPFRAWIPDMVELFFSDLIVHSLLSYIQILSLNSLKSGLNVLNLSYPSWYDTMAAISMSISFPLLIGCDVLMWVLEHEVIRCALLFYWSIWVFSSVILLWFGFRVLVKETEDRAKSDVVAVAAGAEEVVSPHQRPPSLSTQTQVKTMTTTTTPAPLFHLSSSPKCGDLSTSSRGKGTLVEPTSPSGSSYSNVIARALRMRTLSLVVSFLAAMLWLFLGIASAQHPDDVPWRPSLDDFLADSISLTIPIAMDFAANSVVLWSAASFSSVPLLPVALLLLPSRVPASLSPNARNFDPFSCVSLPFASFSLPLLRCLGQVSF